MKKLPAISRSVGAHAAHQEIEDAHLPPDYFAVIKTWSRRSPSWKDCYIHFVDETRGEGEGQKSADRVLAATKATEYEKLDVGVAG